MPLELLLQLEQLLGLQFVSAQKKRISVCYAQSPETRIDFRIEFSEIDILWYVYSFLNSEDIPLYYAASLPKFEIPFPKNSDDFWARVEIGYLKQMNHPLPDHYIELLDTVDWITE